MEYNFGLLLKKYRKKYKITQEELGDIMECSRKTVSKIENSQDISKLSSDQLFRLYYFLSISGDNENSMKEYMINEIENEMNNGRRIYHSLNLYLEKHKSNKSK